MLSPYSEPGFACNLAFRDNYCHDGFSAKAAHGLEAMPAVRGPEATGGREDCDERIEKIPVL